MQGSLETQSPSAVPPPPSVHRCTDTHEAHQPPPLVTPPPRHTEAALALSLSHNT